MKTIGLSLLFVSLSLMISNCSSSVGGTLIGFDKQPVPNSLVKLIVINDQGEKLEGIDSTVTDDGGHFDFGLRNNLGSLFVVEATVSDVTLRGFACGNGSKVNLNPITNSIVKSIIYITETDKGTTLSDFSRKKLIKIIQKVEENADIWDLDFNDGTTLINTVINTAGMLIPEAAEGTLSAVSLASIVPPNEVSSGPLFDTKPDDPCPRDNYLLESSLFGFSVLIDGSLCTGFSNTLGLFSAYGIAYELSIDGDSFVDSGNGSFRDPESDTPPPTYIEDGREIVFGPVTTSAGLSVTRKIYVPETGDFARYIEIFSNPTSSDITINIKITGGLGLGAYPVYGTGIGTLVEQSGNLIIGTGDNWAASIAATPDTPHPTVGFVWDGLSGRDVSDLLSFPPANQTQSFNYWWNEVTIPAGSTKVFMHFSYLFGTKIASEVKSTLTSSYMNPDETGMSTAELNALENFAVNRGNITGEAGSVPSFSDLTITNETTPASLTMKARRDGGFSANLSAQAGDNIKIEVKLLDTKIAENAIVVQ